MKRFYLPATLNPGATVPLPEALIHRLRHVLRMGAGDTLHLFNNDGELAAVTLADAKCRAVTVTAMLPAPRPLPPLTLVLGIPKREAWEAALRQATELGVTSIIPLKTDFAQVGKINTARAEAILIEAAEQSERTSLPTLAPLTPLPLFLEVLAHPCAWAYERHGILATGKTKPTEPFQPDGSLGFVGQGPRKGLASTEPESLNSPARPRAVLIGPEGGFSPEEVAILQRHPHITPFSLGPTILRTDTAVVAALAKISNF